MGEAVFVKAIICLSTGKLLASGYFDLAGILHNSHTINAAYFFDLFNKRHPLDLQYFDSTFTMERPHLSPIDPEILRSMDQNQFQDLFVQPMHQLNEVIHQKSSGGYYEVLLQLGHCYLHIANMTKVAFLKFLPHPPYSPVLIQLGDFDYLNGESYGTMRSQKCLSNA
ncbi:hypothetical protein J437_LFUL019130 [Ladona fulva]|uniref:Protein kinase C-terminal domain-containing protein n=1 Tax=Ladona fulva TaxID=123851 RepID=A0A8K0PDR0_LADFU|nr:hypothetical protein J437_LFUL019130 [Ladona fulva]